MYGYQMIEELARRSNDAFQMKEGTLYPILHGLEKGKYLASYEQQAPTGRQRKYYRLTQKGRQRIREFLVEWEDVMKAYRYIAASQEEGAMEEMGRKEERV